MLEKARRHHAFSDSGGLRRQPSSSFSAASIPPLPDASAADPRSGGDFDKVLYRNLVEMVPLVESLMDKRPNPSFTRRATMTFTAAPSANDRKTSATKNKKTVQSPAPKLLIDSNGGGEEIIALKEQVADLQKKLSDKDEALKSMETSMNELKAASLAVDELKQNLEEKNLAIKFAASQISALKVQLADKQAKLEKLEWEAKTSNEMANKLQGELETLEYEMGIFMMFLEELSRSDSRPSDDLNITHFENFNDLPDIDVDEDGMEDARTAYMDAVLLAKENPNEETLYAAACARQRLQTYVLL